MCGKEVKLKGMNRRPKEREGRSEVKNLQRERERERESERERERE